MAAKSKQSATYTVNTSPIQTFTLSVLKKNEDGTFDLGNEDGELIVGKCPTDPKSPGFCTVNEQTAEQPAQPLKA